MIFSVPNYRSLTQEDLNRLRRDKAGISSSRARRMLINLLLLAGLWGIPFYARWYLLPGKEATVSLPEAIIGKWRHDRVKTIPEFTADKQLRLTLNGVMIESANYQIVGDELAIFSFKLQPGDQDLDLHQQCYQIYLRGEQLIVTASGRGFTPIPWHTQFERSQIRKVLPHFHGYLVQFRREGNR